MPREALDLDLKVEYLSILDKNGDVDPELEPDLPDELLLKMHRMMLMGRRFDKRMFSLHGQGRIGTFPPIEGQEAAQIGAVAAIRDDDWLVPSFRENAAEIWHGKKMVNTLLAYSGYGEGGHIPEGVYILPVSIPVGTHMLHAVGLAHAARYQGSDKVALTFFGDGATSEGDFHEALNFAGAFQAPVIFVCQNNHYAISVPRSKQTRSQTLAQKALAYGLPGMQVDGNDVLAVYQAAREAVERARKGDGASLIECVTYRLGVHTTADDPTKYRTKEEVAEWKDKEPIARFQKYLKKRNLLTDDDISAVEKDLDGEIQKAVDELEEFKKKKLNPLDMFDHVYGEAPRSLKEQRSWLEGWIREEGDK